MKSHVLSELLLLVLVLICPQSPCILVRIRQLWAHGSAELLQLPRVCPRGDPVWRPVPAAVRSAMTVSMELGSATPLALSRPFTAVSVRLLRRGVWSFRELLTRPYTLAGALQELREPLRATCCE